MTQVLDQAADQFGHKLDLSHDGVAASAEQPTHAACLVAMVDDKIAVGGSAQEASTILGHAHRFDLCRREAVFAHEAGTQVLRFCQLGITAPPIAEPLIAGHLVGLSILPVAPTGATSALRPLFAPLAELRFVQSEPTYPARQQHPSIMAWRHDITVDTDQPCHADVLLTLANPKVLVP